MLAGGVLNLLGIVRECARHPNASVAIFYLSMKNLQVLLELFADFESIKLNQYNCNYYNNIVIINDKMPTCS